jgi:polysaccharide export outer membrane protein
VIGQVARPGRYALDDGNARLTDLIALAGGITPAGDDKVTVVMNRNGKSLKREIDIAAMMRGADMSGNVELANGDTVYVPRAGVFYVYGEVARSGAYRIEPNLSVRQAITLGGGLTPRGTEKGLTIHRTRDGKTVQMEVKPTDIVQADDIVFVKESFF